MHTVQKDEVRPSVVAGFFYPETREMLERELDEMLEAAPAQEVHGAIKALISPHAGYQYSGQVAAFGYRQLRNQHIPVIAVIAPSHYDDFPGVSVFDGRGYETPLGLVPVATDLAEALIEQDEVIKSSRLGHEKEHALEVQLPFIQKVLPHAEIIPIVIRRQEVANCVLLGQALSTVLEHQPALIVASSDLSHFHSYEEATAIDSRTSEIIERFDVELLKVAVETGECEACGAGPILAAMVASKKLGADKASTLIYRNSGDASGDYAKVVGYLSAAFYQAS
ncbi:MAG: AmmeMemoRadiSam system protein B [bacterium]